MLWKDLGVILNTTERYEKLLFNQKEIYNDALCCEVSPEMFIKKNTKWHWRKQGKGDEILRILGEIIKTISV